MELTQKQYERLGAWGNMFAEIVSFGCSGIPTYAHKKKVEEIIKRYDYIDDLFDDVEVFYEIKDRLRKK